MAKVVFLTSDLMFSSRVGAAARGSGVEMVLVVNAGQLPDKLTVDCRLVLVDLSMERLNLPSIVGAVRASAPQASVIAYGAHVDHAGLADAGEAGCDQVLTRNQFNQKYVELLQAAAE
jgi:DNA-binding NarL/FixJ family response regulator